jgi:hypothetical protein
MRAVIAARTEKGKSKSTLPLSMPMTKTVSP